ncbi:MAG: response regulator [Gemmatimonadetes bacterium]|nr:response regulator [Gemmatimonadota bacterium]
MPGHTILLVEDNEDNRVVYRTMLMHFGFTVVEAGDGRAALERVREARPDLILMDISIPVMDGWEATRALKADPATAAIPVIALTAHALDSDRARSAEIVFDVFLAKPVEPRRVVSEVRRILRVEE